MKPMSSVSVNGDRYVLSIKVRVMGWDSWGLMMFEMGSGGAYVQNRIYTKEDVSA